MKKIVITILYWVFAVSAIAFVLWRAGLPLWEPVLMALLFIPGCMALKFILPKISFRNFREGILNVFYILCAVVLTVMLMLMISQLQLNMDGIFQSEYTFSFSSPLIIYLLYCSILKKYYNYISSYHLYRKIHPSAYHATA